jgi:hypothetical protein
MTTAPMSEAKSECIVEHVGSSPPLRGAREPCRTETSGRMHTARNSESGLLPVGNTASDTSKKPRKQGAKPPQEDGEQGGAD